MSTLLSRRMERASRKMIYLRDQYMNAFPDARLPLDPRAVADWAYDRGLWQPTEVSRKEVLRRKLCRAFRHEYTIDPQGREVRANFAAVVEVMTTDGLKRESKFYPIFKAPPEIADQQFALDRRQALGTVQQMKLDFDSYNDNNEFGATLQPLDLNFQRDIDEMSLPAEYDPYGDEEDED
jgi:hypothetical protein